MTSLSSIEGLSLVKAETVQEGADSTLQITTAPTYTSVEDFVAHVIYDGRFLHDFTAEPEQVAMRMGITISSEVAEALRNRDHGQVLSEVTDRMTRDYGQRTVAGTIPDVRADFGISTAIVIGAIAIATIVVAGCGETAIVMDASQDSNRKL